MATAELPFELIEAKLSPPPLRADSVVKAELVDRLRKSETGLASIVAPAGWGKTTLIAHWAERDPRPFAYLSLDDRDNDAVVLLRYVAAGLDRVEPIPEAVFDAMSRPAGSIWSTCVPKVGAAFSALQTPLVLVLDDLHFVQNPTCTDVLAALLEHVPEGSQIAVATRENPDLPLARLRAQGRLLEIGPNDLRLGDEEAAVVLRGAGVDLDPDEVSDLNRRTEGWPAGLYLAALSLQSGASTANGTRPFSGTDRFVSDYLRLELLSLLSDDEVRFLTHTSVLDRMCGGLCDALLGRSDSASVLESLERSNRFLVPLDGRRQWYRYHHLFRDLLRNELERREPGLVPELNRRAMEWCLASETPEAAIHYGRQAGETDAVARLVESLALPTYWAGGSETVETWCRWYDDDELLQRHPALAVIGAWLWMLTGRPLKAEHWAQAAERSTLKSDAPDDSASLEPWLATLRAGMCAGGIERMLTDAELALDQLGPRGLWRPTAQLLEGVAHALLGDGGRAREALWAAAEVSATTGDADNEFVALAELALLAMAEGDWEEAERRAESAVALVSAAKLEDYVTSAIAYAVAARVSLYRGDTALAREHVARIHRVRPLLNHALPWFAAQVGLELSRVHLALGEGKVAGTTLREVEAILRVRPNLGTLTELARELRARVTTTSTSSGEWALSLTAAELRLLPLLTTHLNFPQIGERLFVSRNTVKTQAISIYRKFGVSTRAEAIERAVDLGLLEDSNYAARTGPVASG